MSNKQDIFKIGRVINPLTANLGGIKLVYKKVTILYPARLNAMALDPGKIEISKSGIYTPGEIVFPIQIFKEVSVEKLSGEEIVIETKSKRPQLIIHSVRLMQNALGIKHGFKISVKEGQEIRHAGFGSSSGIISAVAASINELYNNPIKPLELVAYLAQNHGEEIDGNPNFLQHVQCIGGSASAGMVKAGMIVLAGASVPIATMKVPEDYAVVIGIPKAFKAPDAKKLMELEMKNMSKFIATGKRFGPKIGYEIVHRTLPAMFAGNLKEASRIIFDYRFHFGSIDNCSFVYPPIKIIAKKLLSLFDHKDVMTLALSSVGPAFFAITTNEKMCKDIFEKLDMNTMVTKINNDGYKIIKQQRI